MSISFVKIEIETASADREGILVLWEGRLAAVMSLLGDPAHGASCGRWFLEAGFGACSQQIEPFLTLELATQWVEEQIASNAKTDLAPSLETGGSVQPLTIEPAPHQ